MIGHAESAASLPVGFMVQLDGVRRYMYGDPGLPAGFVKAVRHFVQKDTIGHHLDISDGKILSDHTAVVGHPGIEQRLSAHQADAAGFSLEQLAQSGKIPLCFLEIRVFLLRQGREMGAALAVEIAVARKGERKMRPSHGHFCQQIRLRDRLSTGCRKLLDQ